jgi:hypothetical protein
MFLQDPSSNAVVVIQELKRTREKREKKIRTFPPIRNRASGRHLLDNLCPQGKSQKRFVQSSFN